MRLGGGIDRKSGSGNFNRGGFLPQCKLDRQRVDGAGGYDYVVNRDRPETASRDADLVRSERQVLKRELAIASGRHRISHAGGVVYSFYAGIGDNCPRGIRDCTVDCTTKGLRIPCNRKQQK